jgi:histidinol-phosphate/aromatic aminotransferase/cobyric acid decarboxylase-like protein
VISAIQEHLPWVLRTSPPVSCAGMVRAIARGRGVPGKCIVPAAGSSELIFLALRDWLIRDSRVLVVDPCYGEYGHVTGRLIGCHVDRFPVERNKAYEVDPAMLETRIAAASYDLVVVVNPNSPTGRHVPRHIVEVVLSRIPANTRVWVDETYVDYVGSDQSLEAFAATSRNVVICKSMSKVYALSGVRAAYVCAPPTIAALHSYWCLDVWGGRWDLNPPQTARKCLNLLTTSPQFGRIWAQNFASGRTNSPTLSTAFRCASPITWP